MSSPQPDKELYMYLAISDCVVNAMEQTTLALKSVAQKLRPYFQSHQVMVDFIVEIHQKPSQLVGLSENGWWILHINGTSQVSGFGVGFFLQSPTGKQLERAIWLEFSASNNEAEYEAILSGLDLTFALSASKLEICSDSQLVVG
ncbi:hypothetical protein AAG906_023024 [Vitis piasezkii]